MATLKQPNLKITEKSHWQSNHQEAGFILRLRVIDSDIIHAWVETDQDIVLDLMDKELLQMVLSECGLVNRQFYLIWDLAHVVDLAYSYKQAITDILFNWHDPLFSKGKSGFALIAFYNIPESLRIMAESFAAIVPEQIRVILTESYDDTIEKVMAIKSGELLEGDQEDEKNNEESLVRKRFLMAVAGMSWFNMLDEYIPKPPPENRYYPFFKAIDAMRSDLLAKEREKENERIQNKHDFEHRITQMNIKMNAQAEMNKKSTLDLEKEISALKTRIATQDMELTRVSTAIAEKTTSLRNLLDQIHALEIDSSVKRAMTDSCLSLIETETIEKRLNIELTESDSVFLSKLQKKHANLNQRELRISLLVKLNYDTKEIARSVGISTRGMESIRYRMHKKLNLGKHQSIKTYLSDFAVSF